MNNRAADNSFLLGAIVGATAVFLLGTDKGKKILESLTEQGLDNISEFIENAQEEILKQQAQESSPVSAAKSNPTEEEKTQDILEKNFEEKEPTLVNTNVEQSAFMPFSDNASERNSFSSSQPTPKRRFFRRSQS